MRNKRGELIMRDSFFDDFFPLDLFKTNWPKSNRYNTMKTDIVAKDDHYELYVELPGVKKEDVEISLKNGYLSIILEQKQETDVEEKNYIHRERYVRSTCRNLYVGQGLDEKDIGAKLKDGILVVTVPKEVKKVEQKQTIEIK